MDFRGSSESHRDYLARYHQLSHQSRIGQLTLGQDFIGFSFTYTLDREELFLGCESDCFDCMIPSLD
jgi:hypothetical protein